MTYLKGRRASIAGTALARSRMALITLGSLGCALGGGSGCAPRATGHPGSIAPATLPLRPVPAQEAARLSKSVTARSQACFPSLFKESFGRDPEGLDGSDRTRQSKASEALGRELEACLTGQGYGGQAVARPSTVSRWLSEKTCEGFAKQALSSRECFSMQLALEEAGFPLVRPRAEPPRRKTTPPRYSGPAPVPTDGYYRASHILVFYAGAQRAPATVTRTRAAALALATSLAAQAKANPSASFFASLAKRHSECSSAARGGDLGRFQLHQMVPTFSAALKALHPGEASGPVETPFGYHVILRH